MSKKSCPIVYGECTINEQDFLDIQYNITSSEQRKREENKEEKIALRCGNLVCIEESLIITLI